MIRLFKVYLRRLSQTCGSLQRITDPAVLAAEFTLINRGVHFAARLNTVGEDYQLKFQCLDSSVQESKNVIWHHWFWYSSCYLVRKAHGFVQQRSDELMPFISQPHSHYWGCSSLYSEGHLVRRVSQASKPLSHCFKVKVLSESDFACRIQQRPECLWDSTAKRFITDGDRRFTGIAVCTSSEPKTIQKRILLDLFHRVYKHESVFDVAFGLARNGDGGLKPAQQSTSTMDRK